MNKDFFSDKNYEISVAWMAFISVTTLVALMVAPLDFALESKFNSFELWLEGIICIVFSLDIYFRWNKKFIIKDLVAQKHFFEDPKTFKEYRKSVWPAIDLICALPIEFIAFSLEGHLSSAAIAFIRLFRFFRLFKLRDWGYLADYLPKSLKLILIASAIGVTLHWIACGWMVISPRSAPDDTSFYIISLYWAVTTLTTVGYGDIAPVTNMARIYTMGVMIVGVGVYGVIIGNISRIMMLADKYTQERKDRLNGLRQFMKHYNIPNSLQTQVFSFYNHLINKNIAVDDQSIIKDLPQALQNELNIYTKIKLIKNLHIFRDCSTPCLKMIAQRLEQTFHSPHEYIIRKGDIGEEMFILGHGKVQVCSAEKVLTELQEGQFFGEIALLENTVRNADIKSIDYCDLYTFKKADFLEVIEKYPTLGDKFKEIYFKRTTDKIIKAAA